MTAHLLDGVVAESGTIAHVDAHGILRFVACPTIPILYAPPGCRRGHLYRLVDVEALNPPGLGYESLGRRNLSYAFEPFPAPGRDERRTFVDAEGRTYWRWADDRFLYVAHVDFDPYVVWDCWALPRMEPVTVWYVAPPAPPEVLW